MSENRIRVGLSGYVYKPWQGEGRFYPPGLPASKFLNFYAERYNAVEMDGSWFKMPAESSIKTYSEKGPADFEFCYKMHRQVTHITRLKPEGLESLQFFLSRLAPLAKSGRCGPILMQLPPTMKLDIPRWKDFCDSVRNQFFGETGIKPRFAFEFRDLRWHIEEVFAELEKINAAFVFSETDEREGRWEDTADFCYARLRKADYSSDELAKLAEHFKSMDKPGYVFMKHEDDGSPWIWADQLIGELNK